MATKKKIRRKPKVVFNSTAPKTYKAPLHFGAAMEESSFDSAKARPLKNSWLGSYSDNVSGIYVMEPTFTDYSEYPATQLFLKKNDVFPSVVQYDCLYNYKEFIDKMKGLKGAIVNFTAYGQEYAYLGGEPYYKYLCISLLKHKLILYISLVGYSRLMPAGSKSVSITILFNPSAMDSEQALKIVHKLINLPEVTQKEEAGFLYILGVTQSGYELSPYKIKSPEIDFSLNYNADFSPVQELILSRLQENDSKGLVLLYGIPGSGKTTYVKWLINNIKKRIIFIPPNMVNVLSDPSFIKFLLAQKNSILVVEDAENILMQRDGAQTNQSVSNILNLTDGILSDCANIQVVATFNTNIGKIDKALLRKGRLIAKYEFKELSKDRADELAKKLGVHVEGTDATLANIYNAQEDSFEKQDKNKIGFKA